MHTEGVAHSNRTPISVLLEEIETENPMNRLQLSTAALLSLGLVGVSACTHGEPAATRAEFDQADSNHDGRLNSEEHKRLLAIQAAGGNHAAAKAVKANLKYDTYTPRFKNADANGDGYLSADEYGVN